MKILSIDTSANVATASITNDDILICEIVVNNKLTHSQTLMPIIDEILKKSEISIDEIDLIAVANGPGSFTGLRIGVSAAKGLSHALKIPVVPISTLKSLAYNLPYCSHTIVPIMDARREQVYNGVYKWENEELCTIKEPRALGIVELLDELVKNEGKFVFLGDGTKVHKEIIKEKLGEKAIFSPSSSALQRASTLAPIAKRVYDEGGSITGAKLEPEYLRKSQAEREAENKEKLKGDN